MRSLHTPCGTCFETDWPLPDQPAGGLSVQPDAQLDGERSLQIEAAP
jgi:hypothetical protein